MYDGFSRRGERFRATSGPGGDSSPRQVLAEAGHPTPRVSRDGSNMDTIFLVDDDPAVRKSLARVLRENGWTVEAYDSAEAFLARPTRSDGGCLVLDVTMPGLDGFQLQRYLTEEGQTLPIVFLTGDGDIQMSVRAMKAGADDFLTKPVNSKALLAAVRAAISSDISAREARAERAKLEQRLGTLTAREREVLAALVKGRLNKQIASDLGIVEQTVKYHRARIMGRMQARTASELMHIAARLGIEAAAAEKPHSADPLATKPRARKRIGPARTKA
jgi:FixJ family two-component response regulator